MLSDNKITDEGAKHIGNALEFNRHLTRVDLSNNKITNEGTKYISKPLQYNNQITQVNLKGNVKITDEQKRKSHGENEHGPPRTSKEAKKLRRIIFDPPQKKEDRYNR